MTYACEGDVFDDDADPRPAVVTEEDRDMWLESNCKDVIIADPEATWTAVTPAESTQLALECTSPAGMEISQKEHAMEFDTVWDMQQAFRATCRAVREVTVEMNTVAFSTQEQYRTEFKIACGRLSFV